MNPNDQNDALIESLHVLRSNALSQGNVNKMFAVVSENLVNKMKSGLYVQCILSCIVYLCVNCFTSLMQPIFRIK